MTTRPINEMDPIGAQRSREIQPFGTRARYPLGLSDQTRAASVGALNQLLVDSITTRDVQKKHLVDTPLVRARQNGKH